ncbi:MAG: hypothetical protein IH989_03225 [Planctomycetes bacterium]|nr:hypothetical protein [Planctomycetota bacterium]
MAVSIRIAGPTKLTRLRAELISFAIFALDIEVKTWLTICTLLRPRLSI